MRRMAFGSLWTCHISGRDFKSCWNESLQKTNSSNECQQGNKKSTGLHFNSFNAEIHKRPTQLATSPSSLFSNAKDASSDISFSQPSSTSTFRSRKLTTSTRPYQKLQHAVTRNKRKTNSSYPTRKIMFATEVDELLSVQGGKLNRKTGILSGHALPFPQEKVGAFTCHGLEPSEYLHLVDPLTGGDVPQASNAEESVDCITGLSYVMKKINQDRGAVVFPYGKDHKSALFGVYDGHGDGGEQVSQYVMTELEKRLHQHPDFETNIQKALKDVFLGIDRSLKRDSPIDPTFCGTTACIVVMRDNTLHISNIGDSRAILCRRTPSKKVKRNSPKYLNNGQQNQFIRSTIELTQDQNPELPSERRRIEKSGGYVSPSPEPGVSARVWINPTHTFLGLAMSRSVGDFFLKRSGVIAEPVVSSISLNCKSMDQTENAKGTMTHEDEFIVIASDGVWEYMDSNEVGDLVGEALDEGLGAAEACKKLIVTAAMRWKDCDYYYRDDITAIVVKVDGLFDTST